MAKKSKRMKKKITVLKARDFQEKDGLENPLIEEIGISRLIPNKYQPRHDIKDESIKELAQSIGENGIIQPIIVREIGGLYEIIAGERRFRASEKLGLKSVPCIVKNMSDDESAKLALIENIQREDLNIVEEAMAFKKMLEDFHYTQNKLSMAIGKSRSYIANTVRLLDLDERVLGYVKSGSLSVGHGKVLLGVKDLNRQKELADMIIDKKLTVRQAENFIKEGLDRKPPLVKRKDQYLLSLENELMMSLGTRVNLVHGKDKGIIEIEYYGEEDLGRILDLIK